MKSLLVLSWVVVLCLGSTLRAWSTKEHVQLARMAAEELLADPSTPADMKQWLKQGVEPLTMEQERQYLLNSHQGIFPHGVDGIPFWAVMPDLLTMSEPPERNMPPFGVHERLLHYIDLEYFVADESKRRYADDLSGKPRLEDIPRDMSDTRWKKAGMLPWRVEQSYKELVKCLKEGRLADRPGQFPRDEHAVKWAGMLAHYAADNTQPQHNTIDYKSQSYFPGVRRSPNVHSEVEYKPVDDDAADYPQLREEYWEAFSKALANARDPVETEDVWLGTMQVSLASYDALPLIGHAAVAAAKEGKDGLVIDTEKVYRFAGAVDGREMTVLEMKAHQQAWAVKRIERLWVQAWREAHGEAAAGSR